jgi:rod shape-determining protein MreB
MLKDLVAGLAEELAIDLGTANTLVYAPGRGIVIDEPSVVAYRNGGGKREILAVGASAKAMNGRAKGDFKTVRPMRDGVIADFVAAEAMIRQFIERARQRTGFLRPRVMVCVPASSTPVERRAIYASTMAAGAGSALLIEEPVAAALGANLPVEESRASMVVDIGGGTTDIAVMALGGVLKSRSVRCAGDAMDDAIVRHVRRRHHLQIGHGAAERIKIDAGVASAAGPQRHVDVLLKGKDLRDGEAVEVVLQPADIAEAIALPLATIAEAIVETIEMLTPELATDVAERGICLTGGGAMLPGLDAEFARRTGMRYFMAERPLHSVVLGCGIALARRAAFRNLLVGPR